MSELFTYPGVLSSEYVSASGFDYTPRLLTHILWMSLYETFNKVASYSVPLCDLLRTQLYFLCVKEKIFWIIPNMLWIFP